LPRATISASSVAASRMSAIRSRPIDSQRQCLGPDSIVAVLESAERDDVNGAAEECLEIILEMEKVEKGTALFEVDEEVDVTRRGLIAASHRTEDRCRSTLVLSDEGVNFFPPRFDDRAALTHFSMVSPEPESGRCQLVSPSTMGALEG
jgi:hypothetical protein